MKYEWSRRALSDLHELTQGFENPETASRIKERIMGAARTLAAFPRMGAYLSQFAPDEFRRLIVDDYEIRYLIDGDMIIISNIFHTRQDRIYFQ